ncbi:MAG: amidohydrolase family protein [Phycisphaerales bacterium]|nr:amidohydrolase family protein [Phycisphaerales bacterium]
MRRSFIPVIFAGLVAGLFAARAAAQPVGNNPLDPQPNGLRKSDPDWHFLLGPTVHLAPGRVIQSGIVEIRGGHIVGVVDMSTVRFAPPPGAQVHDMAGLHVYPGFIDAHLAVEAPRPPRDAPGSHWNGGVTPQRSALDADGVPTEEADRLRRLGFGAAAIAPDGGIFAGRSAVVSLAPASPDASDGRPRVYREDAYQAVSFSTRGPSNRGAFDSYPDSEMGAIALMRQTLSDADWRDRVRSSSGTPASADLVAAPSCLDSLSEQTYNHMPLLFRTRDELEGLRAGKVAREFGRHFIVLGSGTEFRRLDAVRANTFAEIPPIYILPLTMPEAPDVDSIGAADSVGLRELMTWEQAPTNARRLDEAGVRVCLTAGGLRRDEKFDENLAEAIKVGGLDPEHALAMLTTTPASVLGVDDRLGTLDAGMVANLIVATGDLFTPASGGVESTRDTKKARILDLWIDGHRYAISNPDSPFDGAWTLRVGDAFEMELEIRGEKVVGIEGTGEEANRGDARKVKMDPVGRSISFVLDDTDDGTGSYVHSGVLGPDGVIRGTLLLPDGSTFNWTAMRHAPAEDAAPVDAHQAEGGDQPEGQPRGKDRGRDRGKGERAPPPEELPGAPFGPYALKHLPAQQTVIFQNGTVWTEGPRGVLQDGWVAIEEGKVLAVGTGVMDVLTKHDPIIVDLHGRHITPGLIDCHSHTGISGGVNEGGQAVTAECRIADVTDPDDVTWYRQLAGGLTIVNNLHGSANPIGGQSQTNKIRWGVTAPDDMHMEGAKPGIKFALGENVRQSNWETDRTRYPQSRMGVETIIRDRFTAAREYAGEGDTGGVPKRRDLELDALSEILSGDRLLHCHSYRQDEILMLCRVADDFHFKIGTFQHGLEVYKVAEVVRDHAIGASLFSDWWAYKVEVQDAIAQAGPLQTEVGVLTSYNSDSDELARRLNVEAGKAVKYSGGRLGEEDALRFVTINPAKQLGIDGRVGSIEVGKDADLAIWSGDPLSAFSKCEATYVDGREYFSLEQDARLREVNAKERARIIQKILAEGAPKAKPKGDDQSADEAPGLSAGTLRERIAAAARLRHDLDLYLRGIDPASHLCGDCGQTELQLGGAR